MDGQTREQEKRGTGFLDSQEAFYRMSKLPKKEFLKQNLFQNQDGIALVVYIFVMMAMAAMAMAALQMTSLDLQTSIFLNSFLWQFLLHIVRFLRHHVCLV